VQAAIEHPHLGVPGTITIADSAHRDVQRAVGDLLPVASVRAVMPALQAEAQRLLGAWPEASVRDLVRDVAVPWTQAVTAQLMELDQHTLARGLPLSQVVFDAAAQSPDGSTTEQARLAVTSLAVPLGARASPAAVQTFVALSQSLPAVVSSAVLALLEYPAQLGWLRRACEGDRGTPTRRGVATRPPAASVDRAVLTAAAHELLRHAAPTRAVYRRALAPVRVGPCEIGTGDLVVVRLADANRDSTVFPDADRLDLSRGAAGHVAFGAGAHRCSGAVIVRLLVEGLLEALVRSDCTLTLDPGAPVQWMDGPALRALQVLPVIVRPA
jgi:cytochrome P450